MADKDKVQAAARLVLTEATFRLGTVNEGSDPLYDTELTAAMKTVAEAALTQSPEMGEDLAHRWNIERDGDALLICEGNHHNADKCEFVRYVAPTPSPSRAGASDRASSECPICGKDTPHGHDEMDKANWLYNQAQRLGLRCVAYQTKEVNPNSYDEDHWHALATKFHGLIECGQEWGIPDADDLEKIHDMASAFRDLSERSSPSRAGVVEAREECARVADKQAEDCEATLEAISRDKALTDTAIVALRAEWHSRRSLAKAIAHQIRSLNSGEDRAEKDSGSAKDVP